MSKLGDVYCMSAEELRRAANQGFRPTQSASTPLATVPPAMGVLAIIALAVGVLRSRLAPVSQASARPYDHAYLVEQGRQARSLRFQMEWVNQQTTYERLGVNMADYVEMREAEEIADPGSTYPASDPDHLAVDQSEDLSFRQFFDRQRESDQRAAQPQLATSSAGQHGGGSYGRAVITDLNDDCEPTNNGYEGPIGQIDDDGFGTINFHGIR